MNRLRIIWGYQEELSSTAGHGECSVGVNRNKKQTRHPARHPTRRSRWRWHETRSRPRLSLPRKWQRRRRRLRSMPTFLHQSWFPPTMRSQSLPYVSGLDAKPASMPRGRLAFNHSTTPRVWVHLRHRLRATSRSHDRERLVMACWPQHRVV
jgi:hypothetical protein